MPHPSDSSLVLSQLSHYARAHLLAANTDFNEHTPLAALGIDSFSLVELLLFSERTFAVTVPESHLTRENLVSLSTLAQCIAGLARSAPPSPVP